MEDEIESMKANDTWELVFPPDEANIVSSRWTYRIKTDANGAIEKYKARLVARGFSQVHGIDYLDTFAPVISMTSLRTFLAISAWLKVRPHHLDVVTAYLNSSLTDTIFMKQPDGFVKLAPSGKPYACRLKKAVYGLKQSGRQWWKIVSAAIASAGFKPVPAEPCLFVRGSGAEIELIALYVDDIAIATKSNAKLQSTKDLLMSKFKIKDLGELTFILGMKVSYEISGAISISQEAYVRQLLVKYGMQQCKPAPTPLPSSISLTTTADEDVVESFPFRECIGSLLYASVCTRPDISSAVNLLARFTDKPSSHHVSAIKHVLRYLQKHPSLGCRFGGTSKATDLQLSVYVDADWAGDKIERKSVTGFVGFLNGPIFWCSKRQLSVALSSTEAEYVSASTACQEVAWCRQLLHQLGFEQTTTQIYEDNQATIALAISESVTRRCKHIDIRHHYLCDLVQNKIVRFEYCPTESERCFSAMKRIKNRLKSTMGDDRMADLILIAIEREMGSFKANGAFDYKQMVDSFKEAPDFCYKRQFTHCFFR